MRTMVLEYESQRLPERPKSPSFVGTYLPAPWSMFHTFNDHFLRKLRKLLPKLRLCFYVQPKRHG